MNDEALTQALSRALLVLRLTLAIFLLRHWDRPVLARG